MKKDLMSEYPDLFDPQGMVWPAIECGAGWELILTETFDQLRKLARLANVKIQLSQVKEKFGGLRIYFYILGNNDIDDIAYAIVDNAENMSYRTCEKCGKDAELCWDISWYHTLCESCDTVYHDSR